MKAKQKPTAVTNVVAAGRTAAAGGTARNLTLNQRYGQPQCERERKHEAARKEREMQALTKREMTAAKRSTFAPAPTSQVRRPSRDRENRPPQAAPQKPLARATNATIKTVPATSKLVPATTPRPVRMKAAPTIMKDAPTTSRAPLTTSRAPLATARAPLATSRPPPATSKAPPTTSRANPSTTKAAQDAHKATPVNAQAPSSSESSSNDEETARLQQQLEHLSQLSEKDFEREFRNWMAQEGIEDKMHARMRMDLINSFNSTSLGQLLSKQSASATRLNHQQHHLLLSPLAMALHTLVAEFLYAQNCHYSLSVFCSEMPHRHTLPNFENRTEFRFTKEELHEVLMAVLGTQTDFPQIGQVVLRLYGEADQSLLLALVKTLVDERCQRQPQVTASTMTSFANNTAETQTSPKASQPEVDMSQVSELAETADGNRSVFIGPRVSQALDGVDQQLFQLMRYMDNLCKSCAPPVEVITPKAFEELLQQELFERQRLIEAGETVPFGQSVIKLPEPSQEQKLQSAPSESNTLLTPNGPIQLPASQPAVPTFPHLHGEQLASLAMVQQSLQQLHQQVRTPQDTMFVALDHVESIVGELAGCVQTLSNVLNLAMEQEYSVGKHKGFKLGYRDGFNHGHFMGVQEGRQALEKEIQQMSEKEAQQKEHQAKEQLDLETAKQTEAKQQLQDKKELQPSRTGHQKQQAKEKERHQPQLQDAFSQTEPLPQDSTLKMRTVSTQTRRKIHRNASTNTDSKMRETMDVGVQVHSVRGSTSSRCRTRASSAGRASGRAGMSERSYDQWIYEMLHSRSGLIFLERVELSLNKALEIQKRRLNELYDIRLRHHAELIRLGRRQRSWRTLCRHVERDTHSKEACELVQKIFNLLEHYEAHQQLLAEKIHETEQAAERAARIEPVWHDATFTASTNSVSPRRAPQPSPEQATARAEPAMVPTPERATARAEPAMVPTVLQAVPAAVHATASAAAEPATASTAAAPAAKKHAVQFSDKPFMQSVATNTIKLSQPLSVACPQQDFNEALVSAKNRMIQLEQESNLLEQSFLGYLERTRAQTQKLNLRANCARERQQAHRTLDGFREWQRRMRREEVLHTTTVAPAASPVYSSVEVEQDSYQFTNAISVARQKLLSDLLATSQPAPAAPLQVEQNLELPAVVSGSTNPNLLLMDQMQTETQQLLHRMEATLSRVSKPASLQLLTVEAKLAGFDDVDPLSSTTPTSLASDDLSAGSGDASRKPASHKLQRSMAKMQRLFDNHAEPKSASHLPHKMPITRPWSAPTSNCPPSLLPQRPHTVPSSRTDGIAPAAVGAGNLLGLLDAISDVGDTTVNSSSLGSSLDSHPSALRELYAQLLTNASSPSHTSTTSPISHSLDFWKRMNL